MLNEPLYVALGDVRYRVERPWGQPPPGLELTLLSKLAVDSKGNVYVFRRDDPPVVVFDSHGRFLRAWGEDLFADAHGICVADDDRILLVDRDAHRVVACDGEGRLLFTIGDRRRPSWGAPFNHPTDVAVAPNGDIYVADAMATRRCTGSRPTAI